MSGHIPHGTSVNRNGFTQPAYAGPNMFQVGLMHALVNKDSSGSYPSSSSKVSIVKYDDHFKEKGWCVKNLGLTEEEVKKNPPLALKFGDCPVVVPIPSYLAMCKTTDEMVKTSMGPAIYATADSDKKKEEAKLISFALAKKFAFECGYDDKALEQECLPESFPDKLTKWTEDQNNQALIDYPDDGSARHLRHYMGKFTNP